MLSPLMSFRVRGRPSLLHACNELCEPCVPQKERCSLWGHGDGACRAPASARAAACTRAGEEQLLRVLVAHDSVEHVLGAALPQQLAQRHNLVAVCETEATRREVSIPDRQCECCVTHL